MANFLLHWAAQRGLNVIFESVEKNVVYIFEAGKDDVKEIRFPRSGAVGAWPFETDPKTIYIVDSGGKGDATEPEGIDAFTICLASPNEKHYGQFAKTTGVDLLMMPPWELHEIEAIAPFATASIPGVLPEEVLGVLTKRYNEVGGVLRTLFMSETKYQNKPPPDDSQRLAGIASVGGHAEGWRYLSRPQ